MIDLIDAAINVLLGSQPEPIDWELKRKADEQRLRRDLYEAKKREC